MPPASVPLSASVGGRVSRRDIYESGMEETMGCAGAVTAEVEAARSSVQAKLAAMQQLQTAPTPVPAQSTLRPAPPAVETELVPVLPNHQPLAAVPMAADAPTTNAAGASVPTGSATTAAPRLGAFFQRQRAKDLRNHSAVEAAARGRSRDRVRRKWGQQRSISGGQSTPTRATPMVTDEGAPSG